MEALALNLLPDGVEHDQLGRSYLHSRQLLTLDRAWGVGENATGWTAQCTVNSMSSKRRAALRNRGTAENPPNRFQTIAYEPDPGLDDTDAPSPRTRFLQDCSRSLITYNDSPDVGFSASINPYRGCEHGCIYCYARPTHEFFGLSAGLDFESQIFVKEKAPELLRQELLAKKWEPQVVAMSTVTDPYQPIEGRSKLARGCLEVLAEFRNPVGIITKNHLVKRDIDWLKKLHRFNACSVFLSITTLCNELHRVLEPRTCQPIRRLEAIRELTAAGIPVGVLVAPVLPGLSDHELPEILESAARAGATRAGYVMLRLPHAVRKLFADWLQQHYPDRREKVLSRVRSVRDGRLNDTQWGRRMRGQGIFAEQIEQLFTVTCAKLGLNRGHHELSAEHFRRPGAQQLTFFDSPSDGPDQ